jgi:aryl-alcohol dehydrogenase-like predicted oxidoreductase
MAERKNRDQVVIATKFTSNYTAMQKPKPTIMVNYIGNNTKSLHVSLEASLKKLQTSYLDILYV